MIKINSELVKKYIIDGEKSSIYKDCVRLENEMKIHSDGLFPDQLIKCRRPSESKSVFDYRQKIYEPITKKCFAKVLNATAKIRKSDDWSITYKEKLRSKKTSTNTLQSYCEYKYPQFGSVTHWAFTIALKQYLIDPNALVLTFPKNINIESTEYYQPVNFIFNSKDIIEFKENELAIIYSSGITLTDKKDCYYLFNKNEVWISEKTKDEKWTLRLLIKHDLGVMPIQKIRGEYLSNYGNDIIYTSKINACVPSWNEAVREYSDMQASVCKHMFPTLVIHTNQLCKTCNGTGKALTKGEKGIVTHSQCTTCGGSGSIPRSPYEDIEVQQTRVGENSIPQPAAYYVEKDTNIIKIQDERITQHIERGYSAINFDFLSGINQSGISKQMDRSEFDSFIYSIAEDMVNLMDRVYYMIAKWRYNLVLTEKEIINELPYIHVPEKYNIVSDTYLADQISKMKSSNANPIIINALELEYVSKKFSGESKTKLVLENIIMLDPLPGISEDEKQLRLINKGITQLDYILSSNIQSFVYRAMSEQEDFFSLSTKEKRAIINVYAKEVESQNKKINAGAIISED